MLLFAFPRGHHKRMVKINPEVSGRIFYWKWLISCFLIISVLWHTTDSEHLWWSLMFQELETSLRISLWLFWTKALLMFFLQQQIQFGYAKHLSRWWLVMWLSWGGGLSRVKQADRGKDFILTTSWARILVRFSILMWGHAFWTSYY